MRSLWTKTCVLTVLAACGSLLRAEMVTRRWGTAPKGGPARKVDVPRAKPPTAYVVRIQDPPKLDGKLDEAAWKKATALHLARALSGSGSAAQPTEVRLLRDAKTLYVAVRAFEPLIGKLQATRRGHDGPVWSDDSIEIFLGTGGVYYHFGINALGSTYDGKGKNASWNSGFKAASAIGKSQWVLEVAIPLTKMAGEGALPTEWIANFNRNRQVTGSLQESSWSPTYSGDSHVPSRFGRLLLKPPPKVGPAEEPERPVVKKKAMEILPAGNGAGVVRFDLSDIPAGGKVYRADLLIYRATAVDGRMDEAMIDIEVYPLFATHRAGGDARAAGKPLPIRGPWHDRLDATQAVRQWVAGKTNGGFFFKSCPFWNAEATCLDVWYEGRAKDVPKQVTGVEALHRAGQTFITFKEIDDRVGRDDPAWGQLKMFLDNLDRAGRLRYCVYRHRQRITAENLHAAELIATVKPLSCWNVNGRNLGRAVDQYIATAEVLMTGQWNPWWQAEMDGKYGRDCPIDRLVVPGGAPEPRAAGNIGAGMRALTVELNPKLVCIPAPVLFGDRVDVWDGPVAVIQGARLLAVGGRGDGRDARKLRSATVEVPAGDAKKLADRLKGSRHGLGLTVRPKGARPLPRGAGLYVHTPGKAGKAFYAVCTSLDGVINTKDISPANSLPRPVAETVGIGEPVFQKELPRMPLFNYDQKRLHYVRWVAPPHANLPSRYYNWSVGVPNKLGKSVPLEMNFHRDGYSYWRTHYRIERDSIVLCPHDFPVKTWWYGYHESLGTLRSFKRGAIHPYTERRLLAFVDWAAKNWAVDRNRMLVTGCRGGASGSGALHLALRHPDVFAMVIAGHPAVSYASAAQATDRRGLAVAQSMQAVWGKVDWNLKCDDGKAFWDEHDMLALVKNTPVEADLPYVTMTSSRNSGHPFYEVMLGQGRGLLANFAWGGARYIPVCRTGTYPNAIRQDIARNKCYLAFGSAAIVAKRQNTQINREFGWRVTTEQADRFVAELFLRGRGDSTSDVALRRCQKFKIIKGRTYAWSNKTVDRKGKPVEQKGEVKAEHNGVLTIPQVKIGGPLVVTVK